VAIATGGSLTATGNNITLTKITDSAYAEKNVGIQVNGGNWVGANISINGNTFRNCTNAFRLHSGFAYATGHENDQIVLGTNTMIDVTSIVGVDPDQSKLSDVQKAALATALSNVDYTTNPQKGETDVTASVDPSYTIVIPASVDFGTLAKTAADNWVYQAFDVEAQDLLIESGASVNIAVSGPFVMKDEANIASLSYRLSNEDGEVTAPGVFASFKAADPADGEENGSVSVNTKNITAAGAYSGTMTFTISYVPPVS
jgi:hypothetical protein